MTDDGVAVDVAAQRVSARSAAALGLGAGAGAGAESESENRCHSTWRRLQSGCFTVWNVLRLTASSWLDLLSLLFLESAPIQSGIHCDDLGGNHVECGMERKFQMAISERFRLEEIKRRCAEFGESGKGPHCKLTVNDFVLSIFCHSVHRYLLDVVCGRDRGRYSLITKQYGPRLYLRFFTVFNMRSLIDLQSASNPKWDRMVSRYAAGDGFAENDISTVPIRMPCGEMPFVERLDEIHRVFVDLKNGPTPIITALVLKIGHFLFGLNFVDMILGPFSASKCTFTLSNLMGPRRPLLSGPDALVQNVFNGTNPTHTPLSCGIMSYLDHITFTVVSDQRAVAEPNRFVQCLNAVYSQIMMEPLTLTLTHKPLAD